MGLSKRQKLGMQEKILSNVFLEDFEKKIKPWQKGWQEQPLSNIPLVGNIATKFLTKRPELDIYGLREYTSSRLRGEDYSMIKGVQEADKQMRDELDKKATVEGFSLLGNIIAPDLMSMFGLDTKIAKFIFGGEFGITDDGLKMNFEEGLYEMFGDLRNFDLRDFWKDKR